MQLENLSTFNFLDLLILSLATFRLSVMLHNDWETGPWGLLSKLRAKAGLLHMPDGKPLSSPGSLIEGLMCTHCNSVWIGLAFAVVYGIFALLGWYELARFVSLPLALSGANIMLVAVLDRIG
jgi:hypothetical protein